MPGGAVSGVIVGGGSVLQKRLASNASHHSNHSNEPVSAAYGILRRSISLGVAPHQVRVQGTRYEGLSVKRGGRGEVF